MSSFLKAVITLLCAFLGGTLLRTLKVPAGTIMGSMIAVLILNLTTGQGWVPKQTSMIAQTLVGATIGLRFTRAALVELKSIWAPALVVVVGCVLVNFAIGFAVSKIGGLDMKTALLATAPGGQSEMALLAQDLNADVTKVAVLQSLRLVSVVSIMSFLFRIMFKDSSSAA